MAVDGNWNITMSTPMGDRNATLTLKNAGGTLTGNVLRGPRGWRFEKVVLDVIWRQGNLSFRGPR